MSEMEMLGDHPTAVPIGQLMDYADALNIQLMKKLGDDDYECIEVYIYKHVNKAQRDALTVIFQENNMKLAELTKTSAMASQLNPRLGPPVPKS